MCMYALMLVGYTNTAYTALCYAQLCYIILGDCRSCVRQHASHRAGGRLPRPVRLQVDRGTLLHIRGTVVDAVLWGHCDDNLSRVVLLLLNHYMMMMIMTMMIMDDHE